MTATHHLAEPATLQPFREAVADLETITDHLLELLENTGSLLVPVAEVEFIATRLNHLAVGVQRALPPEAR